MNKTINNKLNEFFIIEDQSDVIVIKFYNEFKIYNSGFYNRLSLKNLTKKKKTIRFDFSEIKSYDSFITIFINTSKSFLKKHKIEFELSGLSKELTSFDGYLSNFLAIEDAQVTIQKGFIIHGIEKFGKTVLKILNDGIFFLSFIGEIVQGLFKIIFSPRKIRWEDLPNQIIKIGVKAVPISLLIVFLIGLVTGYQGALQLKLFGADIYIADLISVSLTRELSPLMVAIIVAGRSGSAFTAEIGTMKISEEIDALKMMGFNITDFVIIPKVLASLISVPIIVILADLSGIFGGLVATLTTLDLTPAAYFNRMQESLLVSDIFSGVIKAVIFGLFIAIIGCFRGLQVSGGADSVGHYTTSSVVTSIFHIVIIDSVFTLIFPILGI